MGFGSTLVMHVWGWVGMVAPEVSQNYGLLYPGPYAASLKGGLHNC